MSFKDIQISSMLVFGRLQLLIVQGESLFNHIFV